MQNYLEVIEILLIFAASEMTIRVTFPREGKALSILPVFKELLWQLFYCIYFATNSLKNFENLPFLKLCDTQMSRCSHFVANPKPRRNKSAKK